MFSKFYQSCKMSMKSILSNKGRSMLTMLGIIIGVGSVIILTGIGAGTTKEVTDSITKMGVTKITVNIMRRWDSTKTVKIDDMKAYIDNYPNLVEKFSPYMSTSVTYKIGGESDSTTLDGCDIDYEEIGKLELSSGSFFTEEQIKDRATVCIIGSYFAEEYYSGQNPIGQEVKLNGHKFRIIGVYDETDDSSEESADNKITVPYTSMRCFGLKNPSTYYYDAASEDVVEYVTNDLTNYVGKLLGTSEGYRVSNMSSLLETMEETTGTLTAMLAGIAGISLIVGGIGIMNIMTVSVSERTREIGIRKAIGARTTDILLQFLIESVVLSGCGGVVGIGLGLGIGALINKLDIATYVTQTNMVFLSFAFSLFVGVFFGLAPARKAAKLNPIEALRSE